MGNGESTKFWLDHWHTRGIFKDIFPRLYAFESSKVVLLVSSKMANEFDEMGNEPSQEQRLWNVEDEREARIQRAKKLVEEHWEEVAALKEYEVLYDYQTEYDSAVVL
ncbi:hypothetical protein Tco_0860895 [Tanacetum coccineum]|uniref:Uncharacterized protein n=1 Tax=Tanacetum coccineum TaxID=301880 RepID=A0ABQ5BH37_9ASTR